MFEQVYFTDENEEKWKKRIASIKLRSPSRRRINRLSNYWNSGICLTFFTSANKGQVVQYRGLVVNLNWTYTASVSAPPFPPPPPSEASPFSPDHYYSPTFNVSKSQTTSRVSELVSSFFPLSLSSFSSLSSNLGIYLSPPITQLRLVNTEKKWRAEIQLQNSPSTLVSNIRIPSRFVRFRFFYLLLEFIILL